MKVVFQPRFLVVLALMAAAAVAFRPSRAAEPAKPRVDFNRQIRPILSENCFTCHGPDDGQRKAKLRLDTKEGAFGKLKGGTFAVVPGKPAESELLTRIAAHEPTELMPPPKTGKRLTPEQIGLLRQWIEQGAPWATHWAFEQPRKSTLPQVRDAGWPRNAIDYFILARLEAEGLQPSPEADPRTLIRRLTLDLTGLPPTPAEIDAFLADPSMEAYERLVDRLLDSPRYGEHLARFWLDAARYGDTHGLHLDNYREMWPYREWVIRAFNRNQPFDQFIIEQLAGDLLPNATLEQIIASGFNRCHVTTSEGGSIEEEVYVRNVVDRVDTTGTVFLGLTTGCARCHDHKYDPITMKDYYQLFAFFNSLDDRALDGNAAAYPPIVRVPSKEQTAALAQVQEKLEPLRKKLAAELAGVQYEEPKGPVHDEQSKRTEYVWIEDALPKGAKSTGTGPWKFVAQPEHPVYSGSKSVLGTGDGLTQQVFEQATQGLQIGKGDVLFAYVYIDPAKPPRELMLQWNTGDWNHRAYWGENLIDWGADGTAQRRPHGSLPTPGEWVRLEVEAAKVGLKPGMVINGWAFTQHGGTVYWDKAGIVTRTPQGDQPFTSLAAWLKAQKTAGGAALPKDVQDAIKLDEAKRTPAQRKQLRDYFLAHVHPKTRPMFEPLVKQLAELEKKRTQLEKEIPTTLVSKERVEPRPAFMLKRGEYDQRGAGVGRDTPGFLPSLPRSEGPAAKKQARQAALTLQPSAWLSLAALALPASAFTTVDRLDFAHWLVSPEQPLTARVAVNRLWQQFFGTGIVKTSEDFGRQGELPSHPELLDWLAVQFREDGWDVKQTVKRMVMSATYRQSSKVTPERLAKDPANRLLSRAPRYRLEAEMLRDQALAVSGLLIERLGGPSVKPPQPSGLWEAVGYVTSNTARFTADTGCDKVHRRSLYTFWKRTAAPPQMAILDAPSREACTMRRERTNTPLQALMLLNEPQYVEASRALAERALHEAGPKAEERLAHMFILATARLPDAKERAELLAQYRDHLARYSRDPEAARKLIAVGESKPDERLHPIELAAWTMVANVVLNLDEVLNKG